MSDVIVIIGTVEPRHYEGLYEALRSTSSTKTMPALCKTTTKELLASFSDVELSPTDDDVISDSEIQDCFRSHLWEKGCNIDDVKLVIITDDGLSSLLGTVVYNGVLDHGGKNFPGRKGLYIHRPEDGGWLDPEA
jgi:hypothetical protein